MTWTYSVSSLGLIKNKVRLFSGDVEAADEQLQDEEINLITDNETSPTLAAAIACELIAAKYLRQANTEHGNLRVSAAARHKHYLEMAKQLRAGGAGDVPGDPNIVEATMSVGGTSVDAKTDLASDSDNIGPSFAIGMDDHPDNPSAGSEVDPWDPLD